MQVKLRSRAGAWALLLSVWVVLVSPLLAGAQSSTKTGYWRRLDADITLQPNGDLRVVETHEIVFTQGVFTFGTRGVESSRLTNVTDVQVSEGGRQYTLNGSGQPYTFQTYPNGSEYTIKWYFPSTANASRTFQVSYTATGTVRFYPGGDQIWWEAVFPNHPFPIRSSTVTVHLPDGTRIDNMAAYQTQANVEKVDDRTARFTAQGTIPTGQGMEVRVQFPHGVIEGTPAPWQASVDAEQERLAQQEQQRPLYDTLFGGIGLLTLIGGPLLVFLLWYTRGRDKPVGLVAEYLPEPPSDLPAAVAGTLVDESADMQDVIAAIIDLAHRGAIAMTEEKSPGVLGIGSSSDFIYHLNPNFNGSLRPFEQTLIQKMFKGGSERRLSDMKNEFYTQIPVLKRQLYQELVTEGFFPRSPDATRNGYSVLGVLILVVGGALMCVLGGAASNLSALAFLPGVGVGLTGMVLILFGRVMPRKTDKGAEAAARWQAFRRYLANIEKYTKVEEAKDIFEKYLPYAVAFGLERSWVNKFAQVNTPAPIWWNPYPGPIYWGGGYSRPPLSRGLGDIGGSGGSIGGSGGSREGGGIPSLDRSAGGMFSSLNAMSAGLFTMLNTTSSVLTSTPAPKSSGGGWSGGGWSGGGGFSGGGGGSGGGSGGFG